MGRGRCRRARRIGMFSLSDEERPRFGFDEQFEDRWWHVEFVGWIVMLALVVAGLAGVVGRGPIASARAAGATTVEYERIARYQTPTRIVVSLPANQPQATLFVSRSLLDRVQM